MEAEKVCNSDLTMIFQGIVIDAWIVMHVQEARGLVWARGVWESGPNW